MKTVKQGLFSNMEYWRGGVVGCAAAFFIAAAFASAAADFIRYGALGIIFGLLAIALNLRRREK